MAETNCTNDTLEFVRSIPVNKYIVDVSKLMGKLPNMPIGKTVALTKTRGTRVKLESATSYAITGFDVVVHAALANLYVAGNQAVTTAMVARAMLGYPASSVGGKLCHAIAVSIAKLSDVSIYIQGPHETYRGKLLRVTPYEARTDNGAVATHYRFDEEPVLLRYSKTIGHVYTYPVEAVNTVGRINNTIDVVIVRHHVLRRVAIAARSGLYNTIAYDTLAEECNVPVTKVRRTTKCVLDHLVEMGLVLSYDEYRKNRRFAGVIIKPAHKTGKSSTQNT